ncbi:SWI/SNF complex component SNF12-like protein [Dichanthelium oligosanthes]|uniref:SWI/SNF complex component SNF12-like protein n=1 Tax=Dichanthelium oligosanthes TaxID=888268 RepID=A0A1E5UM29_9POAL|nr:SWI/SNF complex component SNF12-like protein [Dichanthelium oligosanthes]
MAAAAAVAAQSANRSPQKPPIRPPAPGSTSAAAAASAAATYKAAAAAAAMVKSGGIDLTPAARHNKKRKLLEKQLTDRVAALLPKSALYTLLLEFEARVDAALARKKGPRTIPPPKNADPPTWSLKIIGRVLEDGAKLDPTSVVPKHNPVYPKFSQFFKRVTMALDPQLYPENPLIIWENARSAA